MTGDDATRHADVDLDEHADVDLDERDGHEGPDPWAATGAGFVGLLRAEVDRFFARRLLWLVGGALVVLTALTTVALLHGNRAPSGSELAAASEQAYATALTYRENCHGNSMSDVCKAMVEPPTADELLPYHLSFVHQSNALLYAAMLLLSVLGFVVGASFVGAEWSSGGLMNLLLWQPRREAVVGAKFVVALGSALAIAVVHLTLWLLIFAGLSGAVGTPYRSGSGTAGEIAGFAGRTLLVVAAATTVGFALAWLVRRTGFALGIAAAYLFVVELGTLFAAALFQLGGLGRWRLSTYIVAWLSERYVGYNGQRCDPGLGCTSAPPLVVLKDAGATVLVVTIVVGAVAALVSARHRDVA